MPIALIRRLCYASGRRLPKLERIEFPPKKVAATGVSQLVSNGRLLSTVGVSTIFKGNLEKQLYQFYVGKMRSNDNSAVCRWCDTMGFGSMFLRDHGKGAGTATGCKKHLVDIYKTFVLNGQCMMCDARTTRTSWGVPLCSEECEKEWQFHNPRSLRFEIEVFEKREKEAEAESKLRQV